MRVQPQCTPEMMESEPERSVLSEPVIEYTVGCNDGAVSSLPHSGPQSSV